MGDPLNCFEVCLLVDGFFLFILDYLPVVVFLVPILIFVDHILMVVIDNLLPIVVRYCKLESIISIHL